ncbi:type I-E CRISPR-associated protein Cse1/CasA [Nocardiopsis sp. CNT-189]|uniref:type I-E CRISPR-associated protein Cse1/CasA n=1 Tax=Nocardiopsis oceanisediminis TaxID=2816862 RepID=UPI003B30FC77
MDPFDLRERPWIGVRTRAGQQVETGLAWLLENAHDIADIEAPNPPAHAGLRHILTALAYRVTGLDRQDGAAEWRRRRDLWLAHGTFASRPEGLGGQAPDGPVRTYFAALPEGALDLFGPRPFLQDPRLTEQSVTCGINKLVLGRPTGVNSATWWTRHHKDNQGAISAGEAAWWLIAQWYYGAAGQITPREVRGSKTSSAKAGMLRNTITYYPRGENLFDSLLLSLVPPGPAVPDPAARPGPDLCPWELEELPDPDAPPSPPGGMCALLTGVHTHAFLLVRDGQDGVCDVYRTWAYRKPWPDLKTENPFISYERTKGTRRTADPSRALWRDLDSLLPETADGATGRTVGAGRYRPPRFLEERLNTGACGRPAGLIAVGFQQDPMTTDHAWWSSAAPPEFARLLTDGSEETLAAAAAARRLLALIDTECTTVKARLRAAWRDGTRSNPKEKTNRVWPSRGARLFWERAEDLFYDRLAAEGADFESEALRRGSRRAARELCLQVYDEVTRTATAGGSVRPPSRQDYLMRRSVHNNRPHPLPADSPENDDAH